MLNLKYPDDGMWQSSRAKNPKRFRILLKINFASLAFCCHFVFLLLVSNKVLGPDRVSFSVKIDANIL